MEALSSSETSDLTRARRLNIPEDGIVRSHRRENLKSSNVVPSSPILVTLIDGGDTFLRNVGSYKSYTTSHPIRRHSSFYTVSLSR
jgi:hypothetical protein